MTKKKDSVKWERQLITAFETEPFALAILDNTLTVIKPDLMAISFRDFPVLALTGKPGSGKTTIARACLTGNTKEYSFTDRVSAVKKELMNISDGYILLDDFADFVSHAAKERAYTFLDEIVRSSYSGILPLVIITVEERALTHITPSCRERLLEIPVNDVLKKDDLTAILDYLIHKKDKLDEIFTGLAEWYKNNCSRYNYADMLRVFREKHKGNNPRSISMFFAYYASMHVFCDYVSEMYQVTISKDKIERNNMRAWEKRTIITLNRAELAQKMFQALISDKAFSPVKPVETELCASLCDGFCSYYDKAQYEHCCPAECMEPAAGYYYDPRDLILEKDPLSAILIEKASFFYQYPDYCDTNTPLMIIRDDVLLSLMNSELHKLCSEQDIHLLSFGPKELHQKLFELNMCMYNYISNTHKTYIFKYASHTETGISVMVIRLTDRQFKELADISKPPCLRQFISRDELTHFCRILKEMGSTIRGMLGETGK